MSKVLTQNIETAEYTKIQDYQLLVKFKLTLMVVFTSMIAYLIAAGSSFDWTTLALLGLGGFALSGAANGINQVLEQDFDKMMDRTKDRPLPAGRLRTSEAVLFSGLILVGGVICLAMINPLTAFIGMLSFMIYAFVYTPLKRFSTISVAVGAIPGALPVLIGVVAMEGQITVLGMTLFLVQFLWQFPHFWAIAYVSFDDYDRAGYKLLPRSEDGSIDSNLGLYSAVYSVLTIPTVLWAYYSGLETHMIALIGILLCAVFYTVMSLRLQFSPSRKTALGLMFSSFIYLPVVLMLYLIG